MRLSSIDDIFCELKGRLVRPDYCNGCESKCERYKQGMALPEGESSFAIKTTACDLSPIKLSEFLKTQQAQIIPEQVGKVDPNGIGQHEPGAKLDAGKPMADLLLDFGRALLSVAEVGTYGAHKYTRGGWQHVPDGVNRYTGALLRHLLQEKMEDMDQDTDLLHASHCAWNSLARLELILREIENREKTDGSEKEKETSHS